MRLPTRCGLFRVCTLHALRYNNLANTYLLTCHRTSSFGKHRQRCHKHHRRVHGGAKWAVANRFCSARSRTIVELCDMFNVRSGRSWTSEVSKKHITLVFDCFIRPCFMNIWENLINVRSFQVDCLAVFYSFPKQL